MVSDLAGNGSLSIHRFLHSCLKRFFIFCFASIFSIFGPCRSIPLEVGGDSLPPHGCRRPSRGAFWDNREGFRSLKRQGQKRTAPASLPRASSRPIFALPRRKRPRKRLTAKPQPRPFFARGRQRAPASDSGGLRGAYPRPYTDL